MTESGTIKCQVEDYIAVVTLDNPPANTIKLAAWKEMTNLFHSFGERKDVRVAILTAAGECFFCAGLDVKEMTPREGESQEVIVRRMQVLGRECLAAIYSCAVPVICAINGIATGAVVPLPGVVISSSCQKIRD